MTPEKLVQPHESRPWNPIVAGVLYRAGIIEKWGMGTLNILAWCSENANPAPSWVEQAGSVVLTFAPRVSTQDEVQKAHVGTKLALSRHQVEILRNCRGDKGLVELMALTGRTDRTKFRHQVLYPLLNEGLVEMTIPDKLRSSKQKYRLTEKGRRYATAVDRQGKK
jgi:predicted HTH transcriptional regulator